MREANHPAPNCQTIFRFVFKGMTNTFTQKRRLLWQGWKQATYFCWTSGLVRALKQQAGCTNAISVFASPKTPACIKEGRDHIKLEQ